MTITDNKLTSAETHNETPNFLISQPWKDKDYRIRKPKGLDDIDMSLYPTLYLKSGEEVPKEQIRNLLGLLLKSSLKSLVTPFTDENFQVFLSQFEPKSLHELGNVLFEEDMLGMHYVWICKLEKVHITKVLAYINNNKFNGGDLQSCRRLFEMLAKNLLYTRSSHALAELFHQQKKGKKRFRSYVDQLLKKLRSDLMDRTLITNVNTNCLSYAELFDLTAPVFDFDKYGMKTIQVGNKEVTIRLDSHLQTHLIDENNKVLKSLPRIGKDDDKEACQLVKNNYKLMVKEINIFYKMHIERLENDFKTQKPREITHFVHSYMGNPLLAKVAQSVIWALYEGTTENDQQFQYAFMISDDGSCLNSDYEEVYPFGTDETTDDISNTDSQAISKPSKIKSITPTHPINLTNEQRQAFSDMIGDFGIIQPFDQLQDLFEPLTETEKSEQLIRRFTGRELSADYLKPLKYTEDIKWIHGDEYTLLGFKFEGLTIHFAKDTFENDYRYAIKDIDISGVDERWVYTALYHLSRAVRFH